MKRFIQIALPSGHVYEIPTRVIAENRAEAMFKDHPVEFPTLGDALVDTTELFDDSSEIREWALNNMNPDEYMPSARLIRFLPPEQEFDSAEWSYHDDIAKVAEINGYDALISPVEAVLAWMVSSGQRVNVTVLKGKQEDGKPFGILAAVVAGDEATLNHFITALHFTDGMIAKKAAIHPAIIN